MKLLVNIIIAVLLFSSCNMHTPDKATEEKNYEKVKETLEEKEIKNPTKFLSVQGEKRKNLIGQTVVKGIIKNNAKVATYKDIQIKLSFYSKTGTELEQDHETIYEKLAPGTSKKFKSKYFTPKGTDSVAFSISEAKVEK